MQSAVSQQIRRLERELGADLFHRSPRHVRLDGGGAAAARGADGARRRGPGRAAGRPGRGAASGPVPDSALTWTVLAGFAERKPAVQVELELPLPAQERLARVVDGRLDAAFVRGAEPLAGVRVLPLWPDPPAVALPAGHPLAARDGIDLAELAPLPLSITARRTNPDLVDLVVGACHDAGFEPLPGPSGSLQDTLASIGTRPLWTVVYASHARASTAPGSPSSPSGHRTRAHHGLAVHRATPTPHLDALLAGLRRSRELIAAVAVRFLVDEPPPDELDPYPASRPEPPQE